MSDHVEEPIRRTRGARKRVVAEEFIDPETGEPFRRRSMSEAAGGAGIFELKPEWRRKDWDYQWAPIRVFNEPVDAAVHVNMKDAGWRPVHPREMPDAVPPGWTQETIERGNQILYKRPAYLSDEARKELSDKAKKQMDDKFESAQMTPAGTAPRHRGRVKTVMEELPADLRQQYGYTGAHELAGEVEEV